MFFFDMYSVLALLRVLILVVVYSAAASEIMDYWNRPQCILPPENCTVRPTLSGGIYDINELDQISEINYDVNNKSFLMVCNNNEELGINLAADDPALPIMRRMTYVKEVELRGCVVPKQSYLNALAVLNITFDCENYCVLKLTELPTSPQLEGYHLEGLDSGSIQIKKLVITCGKDIPARPKFDFLAKLTHLKSLVLKNGIEPEKNVTAYLPKSLEKLSLLETRLLFENDNSWLTQLQSLNYLTLEEADADPSAGLVALPSLAALPKLKKIKLRHLPLEPLSLNTTWLKHLNLEILRIEYCSLEQLPNGLFEGAKISRIFLKHDSLKHLSNAFEPLQSSLIELSLSSNNLNSETVRQAVEPLIKLNKLSVEHNPLQSLCGGTGPIRGLLSSNLPTSLSSLNLTNSSATVICTDWLEADESLTNINLENNSITNLRYKDLVIKRHGGEPVLLNLKNNELRINNITKYHYEECMNASYRSSISRDYLKRVPVRLQVNSFKCDCNAYWLREMLLNCPLLKADNPDDVLCQTAQNDSKPLLDQAHSLTCPYHGPSCPEEECTCEKRPSDNATVMRCWSAPSRWPPTAPEYPLVLHVAPGTLKYVPQVKLLVELHAPNNNITILNATDLPDTLRVLDVRNNSITKVTSAAAKQMLHLKNALESFSVSLAGNRLACECEDEEAMLTLKLVKISDWNTTQCANDELVIIKTKFCPNIMLPTLLGVTGVLLMLTLAALTLLCLRPRIKQFFFDHNWCMQYVLNVKDDIADPNKTHNVFLSYSNYDEEYALTLRRTLEEHGHRVIIHSDHFIPGETIMQNVIDSVLSARRTLVLASDNFAKSIWGKEEFRTAHSHALERGSSRVIVIRYKLSNINKLPDELQNYISLNTYLDWNDRDFWKKLLRVMPPPQDNLLPAELSRDKKMQPIFHIPLVPKDNIDTGLSISYQSIDRDIPLSELVLEPPLQRNKPEAQEQSEKASPVTPVARESPQPRNNEPCFSPEMKRQQLSTWHMPTVVYV